MNQTVLITGATGFFGRYFVEGLSGRYRIIASSRNYDKLHQLFPSESILKVVVDFDDLKSAEKILTRLCEEQEIHGLINNAYDFSTKTGFNTPQGKIEEISLATMQRGLESGLLAPMLVAKIVGTSMIRRQFAGSLINISSMYGLVAPDAHLYEGKSVFNPVTYSVAKAGLNGLTRYLASFWGRHGIRCNTIAPGAFPNLETDSVNAPRDEEFVQRLESKSCLGRTGHPRDLLGLVDLLLSDQSSYITGQVLSVDGGWTVI